jgi:uncharacterized membrane protein YkvI
VKVNKTNWQIAAAYVGAVVGAGFASGQELIQFFVRFGKNGLWGAALAGALFIFLGGITVFLVKQYGLNNYRDLLNIKIGRRLTAITDGVIMLFLFFGTSVMLSGSGALFQEYLGFEAWVGIMITELLLFLALIAGEDGFLWFNVLTVPLLIIVIILVSVVSLAMPPSSIPSYSSIVIPGSWVSNNWLISSLLYVSYNMVNGVVILVALAGEKRDCGVGGGMTGGLILSILIICSTITLFVFQDIIKNYQIPMLYLAFQVNERLFNLYGVVLWIAMLTTAMANTYGLCQRLQSTWKTPCFMIMIIILILVTPFSMCDFSTLIGRVYPLFGYLSMVLVGILVSQGLKDGAKYFIK